MDEETKNIRGAVTVSFNMIIVFMFISVVAIAFYVAGVDNTFVRTIILFCPVFAIGFVIPAVKYGIEYRRKLKQLKQGQDRQEKLQQRILKQKQHEADLERRVAAGEFEMYLQQFEHLAKTAAELLPASQDKHGFSKFGGLPLVPPGFRWPRHNDEPRQFVAQFDFSEINPDGQLKDFPTAGLMYVFIDDLCNDCDSKVLFYEQAERLTLAKKPEDLETVYKEIFLTHELIKTYPGIWGTCDEAKQICDNNPQDGMDEVYRDETSERCERNFVGGWSSYGDIDWFMKEQEHPEDWVLLCQIASDENCDDDGFMWSDAGTLYFYIRKEDLIAHKFDNVQLDMECG